MQKFFNPPDAASLMNSARSFGNYDLAGALADLIDNSIKAKSKKIWITCLYNEGNPIIRITDDGEGMSRDELIAAMRPASTNPSEERSVNDLGRFGWGMKSASFSQCKKMTVVTKKNDRLSAAEWDLNNIDSWSMGILSEVEIEKIIGEWFPKKSGTEIIWQNCDRLSENGSMNNNDFNREITRTAKRLALIFHRFLSGENVKSKLVIYLNGQKLVPYDPFFLEHNATIPKEVEFLTVGRKRISIKPYILPHFSKLDEAEFERLGGEEGFIRNQGFYLYRNNRLIIYGTWFGLVKFGELSQIIRIAIDIPNSLDELWKITVDKSDAQLPSVLRERLKEIVNKLKKQSSRVYRSKGGRIGDPTKISVWSRYVRNNEITYLLNKDHPIIAQLLSGEEKDLANAAIFLIESNFPVSAFIDDANKNIENIIQTQKNRDEIKKLVDITIPRLLLNVGGDLQKAVRQLKSVDPFSQYWPIVEQYINEKGWNS